MFRIELLVYFYIIICISMILFNVFLILYYRRRDQKQETRSRMLLHLVQEQAARMAKTGEALPEKEWERLAKRLYRAEKLLAFDRALTDLQQNKPEQAEVYIGGLLPLFRQLCWHYRKKEPIQRAYLAYLMGRYSVAEKEEKEGLVHQFLKELLFSNNLYCRENALQAYYGTKDVEGVLEAIRILDNNQFFHHGKLLTEGLMRFRGDHSHLIERLWAELDAFQVENQVAILNYIRFRKGGYEERMLALLQDEKRDSELHFAAIRYLGKYPYPPALDTLLRLAGDRNEARWNYAAISATSLASYPGEKTVAVLKKALHHRNWYVRYNAAVSLEAMHLSYMDMADILAGEDRYAREMLEYRMEERAQKEREEAERCRT